MNVNETPIPDFSLFDKRRFTRPLGMQIWNAIPIETFRGCPYTCTFCNSPAQALIAEGKGQGDYRRRKSMPTLKKKLPHFLKRTPRKITLAFCISMMTHSWLVQSLKLMLLLKCTKILKFHFGCKRDLKILMKNI